MENTFEEIIKRENINLENYITFQKDNGEILAINTDYIKIKQRQDKLMSFTVNATPKYMKEITEYFDDVNNVGELRYNISNTGFIPINFRGITPIKIKPNSETENKFVMSLLFEPVKYQKDTYETPTCETCIFHLIN